MTVKAYIVANKKQELDVLKKFERDGLVWLGGENPTDWITSESYMFNHFVSFPYALLENENKKIAWLSMLKLTDEEIVYDGRKEEKMYKVTQEFMNELIKWRDQRNLNALNGCFYATFRGQDLRALPHIISEWHLEDTEPIERNNRLIAIIQWLNGEDVFEVEEPHKFIVRNDTQDDRGDYWYVKNSKGMTYIVFYISQATKFDTYEEAKEWANSHQVVVEIDANGNEVE